MNEMGMIVLIVLLIAGALVVLPIVNLAMISGIRRKLDELMENHRETAADIRRLRESLKKEPESRVPTVAAERPQPAPAVSPAPPPVPVPPRVEPRPAPPPITPPPVPPPFSPAKPPAPGPAPARAPGSTPSAPSRLIESAQEALGRMWNWLIFGDERGPQGVTREYAIATTWLVRIGIIALTACIVFFLKWSMEKGLIGPSGRVAISIAAGIAMQIWGLRLMGRKYHLIGQGLVGGGLLALYFAVYAAGPRYGILEPPAVTFALMALVTVTAGLLAVRTDSLLIAVLGLAGGYLTPVLIRTPTPNLPAFYSYILLLGLGILGVAHRKQWRLLNYLGFVCTYLLFYGSMDVKVYDKTKDFVVALSFLTAFFVVQSTIVYIHNFVRRNKSTTLEIIHFAANAIIYAWAGYWLIREAHGRPYPALLSLGLAAFFVVHVLAFLRRRIADRALLVTLIALAGAFATWTMPLILEKESLTISLALLAFMFLWLSRRINSNFLENLAHLLYAVVFYRLLFMDLPRNFGHYPHATTWAAYRHEAANRLTTFGVSLISVAGAFFLQRRRAAAEGGLAVKPESDTPVLLPAPVTRGVFYWFGILFAFVFLHLELNAMFMLYQPLRLPLLTLLWCGMAAYFLAEHLRGDGAGKVAFVAMCAFLVGAIIKVIGVDIQSWKLTDNWIYNMDYSLLYVGMRLLDFGVLMAFLFAMWGLLRTRSQEEALAPVFGYGGLALLFAYATLELNSLLHWKLPDFQNGGISVLWALFAVAFIAGGIWKSVRTLRYTGLALAAVVVGKIFLSDLRHMPMIFKVIASMALGIVLLLGSFAYIYSSRKFSPDADATPDGGENEGGTSDHA